MKRKISSYILKLKLCKPDHNIEPQEPTCTATYDHAYGTICTATIRTATSYITKAIYFTIAIAQKFPREKLW